MMASEQIFFRHFKYLLFELCMYFMFVLHDSIGFAWAITMVQFQVTV
jgi:hypothetical protein